MKITVFSSIVSPLLIAVILSPSLSMAGTLGEWEVDGQLPTGIAELGMVSLDDQLFIFGGLMGANGSTMNTAASWLYTPGTGTATPKADMPVPLHSMGVTVNDGQIFSIGGYLEGTGVWGRRSEVFSYDPLADSWSNEASLPFERAGAGAASVDGQIYSIGGHSETSRHALADNDRYDPSNGGGWVSMSPMSQARRRLGVAVVEDKIYAIGGTYHPAYSNYHAEEGWLEIYDPATDTWTDGPSMLTPRTQFATAVIGLRIYTIGGLTPVGATGDAYEDLMISDAVEYFDTETGIWHEDQSLPIPLFGAKATSIGDQLYVAGGIASIGATVYENTVYVASVPEPSTIILLCMGVVGFLAMRFRKRR